MTDRKELSRRRFLGYCAATAGVVASYAPLWATKSHADAATLTEGLQRLRADLAGELLLPDADSFENLRAKAWNTRVPERRPDLIVVAQSAEDVRAVVRFARAHGQRISVRGGGHSWCAYSLRDSGILLDLSQLSDISIDPGSRSAVVGPGAISATLLQKASEHGLAFPVAHCPSPALSGYLLNGGIGWNSNAWGPACANVRAIEMVTAKGDLIFTSKDQHPDLFWAARGGGPGFFAAITRYHLELHPLPRAISASTYTFPIEEITTAAGLLDEFREKLPAQVEMSMVVGTAPPDLAGQAARVCMLSAVAFSDSEAAARTALLPLDSDPRLGNCLSAAAAAPTTFDGLFAQLLLGLPGGRRYAADNIWTDAPLPKVLEGVPAQYEDVPSASSFMLVTRWSAEAPVDTAFSLFRGTLMFQYTLWDDPSQDAENLAWHDRAFAELTPHKVGHFVAETDLAKHPEQAEQSYSKDAWARLQSLRSTHDPDGLFFGTPPTW